jgi:hypothetical protein
MHTAELRHVQIQKDHVVLFDASCLYSLNAIGDYIAFMPKECEHLSHYQARGHIVVSNEDK